MQTHLNGKRLIKKLHLLLMSQQTESHYSVAKINLNGSKITKIITLKNSLDYSENFDKTMQKVSCNNNTMYLSILQYTHYTVSIHKRKQNKESF